MTNLAFQRTMLRAVFAIIGLWMLVPLCDAQPQVRYYVATHTATLSSSTDTVTLQQPAAGPMNTVAIQGVLAQCSLGACSLVVSYAGTAATTTTLAITALNGSATPKILAFSASNVGAGTTVATYQLTTAGTYYINFSKDTTQGVPGYFIPQVAGSNFSAAITGASGTSLLQVFATEI